MEQPDVQDAVEGGAQHRQRAGRQRAFTDDEDDTHARRGGAPTGKLHGPLGDVQAHHVVAPFRKEHSMQPGAASDVQDARPIQPASSRRSTSGWGLPVSHVGVPS